MNLPKLVDRAIAFPFLRAVLLRISILVIFLFIFLSGANAGKKYWVASVLSNWNNILNWSTTSNGLPGASVPGSGDTAFFDNTHVANCNIDIAVSITSISMASGYTGTIIQNGNSITLSGVANFSGGTFTGGTANITITGAFTLSGTAFTSTSAILELRSDAAFTSGSFTHNNGTVKFNGSGSPTISGTSPVFYTLEFVGKGNTYTISSAGNITVMNSLNTSGSLFYNIATGTIDVKGDINSNNTGTGCGGDAVININGTGTQNFNGSTTAGAGALPQVTINKASGTLNLANFPAVSNNFTFTAGTVAPGTSTFCFAHGNVGSYTISGSLSFTNIEFIVNTSLLTLTIPLTTTLTATGDLTIAGGGNCVINTGNVNVNGNITVTNTGNGGGGSATINIVGTGSQTLDATAVTVNQSRLPMININKASGTLSLLGNISFSANVTYTAGTINANTSTCYIVNNLTIAGSFSVYNLTLLAAGNTTITITSGSTITATNTLDIENGSNYITINTGTIAVQGNIIDNNTSTSGGGTGTILINGTGAQSITSTGVVDQGKLPGVTINKVSGTLTLPSLITVAGNWTYTSGALDVSTNSNTVVFTGTFNITGSHTLNNVVFEGSNNWTFTTGATTTVTVNGDMSITGTGNVTLNSGAISLKGNLNLTNTATGGGGSTVISFVGTTNQSIASSLLINQSSLPAININKASGTFTLPALITVRGGWSYTTGTIDATTNNSVVVFAGTLSIGGASHSLNHVTLEGSNNYTFTVSTGTVLTVTGTLSTIGASNIFISTPVAGAVAIQAQGDINISNTSTTGGGQGMILINGTSAQAFTDNSSASQGLLPYVKIQKTSGTLTMSGIISVSRDFVYSSGTVNAGTSTVVFGGNSLSVTSAGMSFYNVSVTTNTTTLLNSLTLNNNLTISGSAILAPGSNTINVGGNWSNWGSGGFTEATSTVNFNGTALQTITTTSGENFTNLTVNNSGSGVKLMNNATAATTLTMTQGNIDLNSNSLTLGTSAVNKGTLSRSSGTIINTGSFIRWFGTSTIADGSISGLFPMGTATDYRPINVSAPSVAPTTGGTIGVAYTNATTNSVVSFADGAFTVLVRKDLKWALSTSGLAGGTYNLQAQGTGFGKIGNVSDLRLTLANSVIGTAGTNAGTVSNPQISRTSLSLANLTNSFYVGSVSAGSPLPIKLISFTATLVNDVVKLDWETAAEINNDHFTVERSTDAVNWQDIQVIKGAINSSVDVFYTTDDDQPIQGISYYRLKQTDIDGKDSYSWVRKINLDKSASITIYPNPAISYLVIKSPLQEKLNVVLVSNNGQVIYAPATDNGSEKTLYVSGLNAGIYFVRIYHKDFVETRKVVIAK